MYFEVGSSAVIFATIRDRAAMGPFSRVGQHMVLKKGGVKTLHTIQTN